MRTQNLRRASAACLVLVAVMLAGLAWYRTDRIGMVSGLCSIGLPNLSRPAAIRSDDLGCAVVGPKQRVSGVLLTGFEIANFITNDLGPAPVDGGFTGSTWYTPNQTAQPNARLDRQFERNSRSVCRASFVAITVEGWPTISPGHYGHLGAFAREFYEDRIISVAPPPREILQRFRKMLPDGGNGCIDLPR